MRKKYCVALLLLLAIKTTCTMELALPTEHLSRKQDYKCYWVARYVHKRSDALDQTEKEKLNSFFEQQSALSQKIQEYHNSMQESDLAAEKFLETFWDKKIKDAYSDYFYLCSGAQYQIAFCLKNSPIASLLNEGKGTIVPLDTVNTITFDSCIKSIVPEGHVDVEEEDYFSVVLPNNAKKKSEEKVSFVPHFEKFTVAQLLFLSHQNDFVLEFEAFNRGASYSAKIIPGIEFMLEAYPFKELLQKICKGSTASMDGDVELRHKLTADERKQLKDLHPKVKHLDEWKALLHALIGIDFRPTRWERFKDRMLLAIPLCLVEGVLPQLIYKASLEKITCALGIVPCCVIAGRIIGHEIFPFLDSYNSQLTQLQDVVGGDGVQKQRLGQAFFCYGMLHYILTIVGEYFLNCGAYTVGSVFGVALYAARLYVLLYGIFSTKTHNRDHSIFGKIALGNPVLRKNKKYCSFTVGDLVQPDAE